MIFHFTKQKPEGFCKVTSDFNKGITHQLFFFIIQLMQVNPHKASYLAANTTTSLELIHLTPSTNSLQHTDIYLVEASNKEHFQCFSACVAVENNLRAETQQISLKLCKMKLNATQSCDKKKVTTSQLNRQEQRQEQEQKNPQNLEKNQPEKAGSIKHTLMWMRTK